MTNERFTLDARLADDSIAIADLGLCHWRLMRDSRWAWTILVPKRRDILEIFDLSPLDQTMLTFEATTVAEAMKCLLGADKINLGTLGNVVPMFHLHVIARARGDANWPGPVWGHAGAAPYADGQAERLAERLGHAVLAT